MFDDPTAEMSFAEFYNASRNEYLYASNLDSETSGDGAVGGFLPHRMWHCTCTMYDDAWSA